MGRKVPEWAKKLLWMVKYSTDWGEEKHGGNEGRKNTIKGLVKKKGGRKPGAGKRNKGKIES